jgi:hypothetical protein
VAGDDSSTLSFPNRYVMKLTKQQLNKLLKLKKQLSKLDHQYDSKWSKHCRVMLTTWSEQELIKMFRYTFKPGYWQVYIKLSNARIAKKQELKDYWKSIVRGNENEQKS